MKFLAITVEIVNIANLANVNLNIHNRMQIKKNFKIMNNIIMMRNIMIMKMKINMIMIMIIIIIKVCNKNNEANIIDKKIIKG